MAIEQRRVTVKLVGAADTITGQAWSYSLRGGPFSRATYDTPKAAMKAGERALKRQEPSNG